MLLFFLISALRYRQLIFIIFYFCYFFFFFLYLLQGSIGESGGEGKQGPRVFKIRYLLYHENSFLLLIRKTIIIDNFFFFICLYIPHPHNENLLIRGDHLIKLAFPFYYS